MPSDAAVNAPPSSSVARWVLGHVPALGALRDYGPHSLLRDLTAGTTVATVAVPQAMAYATLAGLPPQHGLYTAIVMTAVGALLDSSRLLINGPTNALSIALLSALAVVPEQERVAAAVLLALLVGCIQIGIALLRLGDLTRYVSHAVIIGFTVGAGTLLVLDQLKNLLGMEGRGRPDDHFLKRFWLSLTTGGMPHWPTILIGLGTIAVVLAVRQLNNLRRKRGARIAIPQHLVALVLMASLTWWFGLEQNYGVKVVGAIPPTLPTFQVPEVKWDLVSRLAGSAFALAMLGLLEAIAMAKAIATRTRQPLDVNQQCLSEGAANLTGSFFQCIPGSGSLTRSAVNQQAGAVSQWSGVFAAIVVAGTVLLFAPLAQYVPRSSLAGLLLLAAFRMVDRKQLWFHLRATRFDAGVVLATALAAIFISVEFCILIGVFLSFALYVPRAGHLRMVRCTHLPDGSVHDALPDYVHCDRLLIYALEGELFFGAEVEIARHFAAIEETAADKAPVVILVLRQARNPDAAFLRLLQAFHRRLRSRNASLILCGVQPDLARALTSSGVHAELGPSAVFGVGMGYDQPVRAAYATLNGAFCSSCPRRVAKGIGA